MTDHSQYFIWQNDREKYLFDNMRRWRQVAEHEHAQHCTRRGDCSRHIEEIYQQLNNQEETP